MLMLLVYLAAASIANKSKKDANLQLKIRVQATGACRAPEWLELQHGSKVSDLISKLDLTSDADISRLILEEPLKHNQIYIIPTLGKTSIYVSGAVVSNGVIFIPAGTKFNKLGDYVALRADADTGFFKRRRRELVDGEVVQVPVRGNVLVNNF